MPVFYDQLNRAVEIRTPPMRIVSLVPSQTELLFDLGLDRQITGVTKFCIHPATKVKSITKVGGTKQLKMQVIKELKPDLIIANKEENEQESIEELMHQYPVWVSDIKNLAGALAMIESVGTITGRPGQASQLRTTIQNGFATISPYTQKICVAYLIWRQPYMAAGCDTFIHNMLHYCGFENSIQQSRYPIVDAEALQQLNPGLVLLSSEPYPFAEKHFNELKTILPDAKILLVDGEIFSWYGSRLQYAPAYINNLIAKL